MYHRAVIAEVARRLPHCTRRDLAEIVELLMEVWSQELASGGEVIVPGIGRLSIEIQEMRAGGVLSHHGHLRRVYGRFRPTQNLKERIEEARREKT